MSQNIFIKATSSAPIDGVPTCTPQPSKHCYTRLVPFTFLDRAIEITNPIATVDTATVNELFALVEDDHGDELSIPDHLCTSRTTLYMIPTLLSKYKKISFAKPQGCKIGSRSIDWYVDIAKQFGVLYSETSTQHVLQRADSYCEHGPMTIKLPAPSFTCTHWALMFAMQSKSKDAILIENFNRKPETMWLIDTLGSLGAQVHHVAENKLSVRRADFGMLNGVKSITLPVDRNDILLMAFTALVTSSRVLIKHDRWSMMTPMFELFDFLGVSYERSMKWISIFNNTNWRTGKLPITVQGLTSFGFCTDWLPLAMSLLSFRRTKSFFVEHVFEQRLSLVADGVRAINHCSDSEVAQDNLSAWLCSKACCTHRSTDDDHSGIVHVAANDIRHGAAMVLTALGQSDRDVLITNVQQIRRGYQDISTLNKICGNRIQYLPQEKKAKA